MKLCHSHPRLLMIAALVTLQYLHPLFKTIHFIVHLLTWIDNGTLKQLPAICNFCDLLHIDCAFQFCAVHVAKVGSIQVPPINGR
jgi:hypothetical protein